MEVIAVEEKIIKYEQRITVFNSLKLWVLVKCEPWDTNTGMSGRIYEKWRKATRNEVLDFLRKYRFEKEDLMFFKKQKEKLQALQVNNLINSIRENGFMINQAINGITDYGNLTKRKNKKLKHEDFIKNRNKILGLIPPLCTALMIINSNKKTLKQYSTLLKAVDEGLAAATKKAKEKVLREQVKKNIVNKGEPDGK